jgi:hypothetical protein
MWIQFFLENAHFAINLFVALVLFAVFWLYLDAWLPRKNSKDVIRLVGYFLLSVSFLIRAVYVESSILASPLLTAVASEWLLAATRITGYICILIGLYLDRIEPHPEYKKSDLAVFTIPIATASWIQWPYVLYPILAAIIALLYLRRATIGLEDHLKPVATSFFLLAIAEFLSMSSLFQSTDNVRVFALVSAFGPFWIIEHIVYLAAAIVFGKWVFGYLLKQFETQLFMIFTVSILIIFLITTVSFSGLLVKNVQDETLKQLSTNVKVLSFTIDGRKSELLSDAQVVAQNPDIITAVGTSTRKPIADFAQQFLIAKKESTLVIVSERGQVLARGEDRERAGESLSDDPLIKRALLGDSASSVVTRDGVLAPELSVRAATPITSEGKIIGAVLAGALIDNTFVEGLKTATGLETIIYGGNQVSASTIVSIDGKSRLNGIKEERGVIKTKVLINGESYTGDATLLGVPYFGAYSPLKDADGNAVGMLLVGRPQYSVLQTAGRSIELTFLVTAILLVFSVIPAYLVARYLSRQI